VEYPIISHPLEALVLEAFRKRPAHDASSLGYHLAGAIVRGATRAYRKVAEDVLLHMEERGLLYRDELGWWRLPAQDK
jgi:hypothetical protein